MALFVLAGLSVIIAVVALGFANNGPAGVRPRALVYGIVNVCFAVVNVILGFAMVMGSRSPD